MNIVILRTGTSDFGRIGTYNVQEVGLAKALKKLGHDVSVVYLNRPTDRVMQDKVYDFVNYVPHRHIGLHGMFDVNLLAAFFPDRVIMFSDNQLWTKVVANWCKKRGITCVVYFGAVLSNTPRWLNRASTRLILAWNKKALRTTLNLAKTEAVRQELISCGLDCHGVVPVGLDMGIMKPTVEPDPGFRGEMGIPQKAKVLLFVGRLSPYKRPLSACDVLKAMLAHGVDTHLVMIGTGRLEKALKNHIAALGLEKHVTLVSKVPYGDMHRYFTSCDCCINMSPVEIFGMTILESMYYGIPLVAHAAPGPNEIIKHGETGYLCNTDDVREWVAAIMDAISNRDSIATKSRREVEERFSWDAVAKGFLVNA